MASRRLKSIVDGCHGVRGVWSKCLKSFVEGCPSCGQQNVITDGRATAHIYYANIMKCYRRVVRVSAFLSAVCSRKRTGTPPSGTTLGYEDTFTHKHRMQAPLAQAHTHTYRRTHPSAHARRRTAHARTHGRDCPRTHAHARTHLLIRINMRMCARTHPEDTRSRTRSCKQVYQDTKNSNFSIEKWISEPGSCSGSCSF